MIEQVEKAVRAGIVAWQAERHKLDDATIEAIVEYFKAMNNPAAWLHYGPVMHDEIDAYMKYVRPSKIHEPFSYPPIGANPDAFVKLQSAWLSTLYAGSDGMKCEKCQSVTWCVWLSDEELSKLPPDSYSYGLPDSTVAIVNLSSEAALMICQDKLGLVLCVDCANKRCRFCSKPATCYGTYEGTTGYACDDCCGHGCEDGHCDLLTQGDVNADT